MSNWVLDGIVTYATGLPFSARLATSVSRDLSSSFAERPNLNPGFSNNPIHGVSPGCGGGVVPAGLRLHTATNWYDPCAWSAPASGTYGNIGRNTIIGPGLADVDGTLEKGFKVIERVNTQFRFEMFNVLNHTNLGLPNTTTLSTTQAPTLAGLGAVTYTTTSSRQVQFALRISF